MKVSVIAVIDVEIDEQQANGVEKEIISMTCDLSSFRMFDLHSNEIRGKVAGVVPQEWQEEE